MSTSLVQIRPEILGPSSLQRLSADDTYRQRVNCDVPTEFARVLHKPLNRFRPEAIYINLLQQRNYQISKKVVHEIKFGDIAVMKIKTMCGVVTGILILIGSLRCLK